MKIKAEKLQIWELSLLIALCVTLFTGLWAQNRQRSLSSQLVRLHVVAESDSDDDQAVKLKVRDAVLALLTPKLEGASSPEQAKAVIEGELTNLSGLAQAITAREGRPCNATASVMTENFPTRDYESFSLPAGDYVSLRITLGEGQGKNWWCVIFPPLCMSSTESEDAFSNLSEENEKLIVSDDSGYILKFHIIELFEKVRKVFS